MRLTIGHVERGMTMLNVLNLTTNSVMLGMNVPRYMDAIHWRDYYEKNYGIGVPYFNGEGVHDGVFVIVRQCECCGIYHVIQ